MKVTLFLISLISIVKIVSSSDEKDKIPQLNDPIYTVLTEVNKFKNLLEMCAEMDSKQNEEKKKSKDYEGEKEPENMDIVPSEQYNTPENSPSKLSIERINPEDSPKKPRHVFHSSDGVTYKLRQNFTVRIIPEIHNKDERLRIRRQRRLFTQSAFRKRMNDENPDYEVPSKTRDVRQSPGRQRRERTYQYDQNDDEDDYDQSQIEKLTEGLLKTTLEETDETDHKNIQDPVLNLMDKINYEGSESKDEETGETVENNEQEGDEEEDVEGHDDEEEEEEKESTQPETGEINTSHFYGPYSPYKRET